MEDDPARNFNVAWRFGSRYSASRITPVFQELGLEGRHIIHYDMLPYQVTEYEIGSVGASKYDKDTDTDRITRLDGKIVEKSVLSCRVSNGGQVPKWEEYSSIKSL